MAENQSNVLKSTLKSYRSSEMMTIPQLKQAKEIIRNKKSQVSDALVSRKLESMYADYEKQERKINKFYQKCVYHKNPAVREYVRGKRYLLQAIDVKRISKDGTFKDKFFRQKGEKWDYNVADLFRDIQADKIALGVGIGVMGLGVASIKIGQESIMEMLGKVLKDFITKNPAAFGMLAAGASLIALSKIVPSIDKKVQKAKYHASLYRAVKNDIANETYKDESGFDRTFLSNANFANSKEKIVNDLYNFPNLKSAYEQALYDPNSILTNSEKRNLIEALKEANYKIDDYERIKDGRKTKAEEQADKEAHQKQVEKFEEVKSLISNFEKKVAGLNENSFDDLKPLQDELKDLSEKSKQVTETELSSNLSQILLDATAKFNEILSKIQSNKKEVDKKSASEIQNVVNTTIPTISSITASSTTADVQNIQNTIDGLKKKAESITDPVQKKIALDNLEKLESTFKKKTDEYKIKVSETDANSEKEVKDSELEAQANEDENAKKISEEIDALSKELQTDDGFTKEKYEATATKYNEKFKELNSNIAKLKNNDTQNRLNDDLNTIKDSFNNKIETAKKEKEDEVLKEEIKNDFNQLENAKITSQKSKTEETPSKTQTRADEKKNPDFYVNSNGIVFDQSQFKNSVDNEKNATKQSQLKQNTESLLKEQSTSTLSIEEREEILKRIEENISKLQDGPDKEKFNNDYQKEKTVFEKEKTAKKLKIAVQFSIDNIDKMITELKGEHPAQDFLKEAGERIESIKATIISNNLLEFLPAIEKLDAKYIKIKYASKGIQRDSNIDIIISKFTELNQEIAKLNSENKNTDKIKKLIDELSPKIDKLPTAKTHFTIELENAKKEYDTRVGSTNLISSIESIHQRLDDLDTIKLTSGNIHELDSTYEEFNQQIDDIEKNISSLKSQYKNDKRITEFEEYLKQKKEKVKDAHTKGLDNKKYILELESELDKKGREAFGKIFIIKNNPTKENIVYAENFIKDMHLTIYKIGNCDPDYYGKATNKMAKLQRILFTIKNKMVEKASPEERQQQIQENDKKVEKALEKLDFISKRFEEHDVDINFLRSFNLIKNAYLNTRKAFESLSLDNDKQNKFVELVTNIEKTCSEKESKYTDIQRKEITTRSNEVRKKIQELPTHLDDFDETNAQIENLIKEIEIIDEAFTLEDFTPETNKLKAEFSAQKEVVNHNLLLAEIKKQFYDKIKDSNIHGIINNVNKDNYKAIQENFDSAYESVSKFVDEIENNKLLTTTEKKAFKDKITELKKAFNEAINQAQVKESEEKKEIQKIIDENTNLVANYSKDSSPEEIKKIEDNLSVMQNGSNAHLRRSFISLMAQFTNKKKEIDNQKQLELNDVNEQKLINDSVKIIENEISGLIKVDKQFEDSISQKIASLSNLSVNEKYKDTIKVHISNLTKKLETKKQENLNRNKILEQQKKDNQTLNDLENNIKTLEGLLVNAKKVNIESEIKNGHSVDGISQVIDKFFIIQMDVKKIENINQDKYLEYSNALENLKPVVENLENRIDRATKKAKAAQAEKENQTYRETAKIEADSKNERYRKLITYTVREFRDCMGYDAAQKKKHLAKIQDSLDLVDYIHNKLGITPGEAREYINEETGEFIEHKMTSFFTPEKDPELGRLFNQFQKNTLVYNKLCEKGDECNQGILYLKYCSSYRQLVNQVSRALKISEEEAKKLVGENGELSGDATKNDYLTNNSAIRNLKEKIKSAKKEYDDYLAADWVGRQAMVPGILKWKLDDIKHRYKNMVNNIGKENADKNCISACLELKADMTALETLFGEKIETHSNNKEIQDNLKQHGLYSGSNNTTKKEMKIEDFENLVRKELQNKTFNDINEYSSEIYKARHKIERNNKDYSINLDDYNKIKKELLTEYDEKNSKNVSQSTISYTTIESEIKRLLNECKNDKKSGIKQEVIDGKISTANELIESSKQLSSEEIEKLKGIVKTNISEIENIKAETKEDSKDKPLTAETKEDSKDKPFTKEEIKDFCESYFKDYYDAVAKLKTTSDLDKNNDSIENSLKEFNDTLQIGEENYGKEFADEIREYYKENIDYVNELISKLPKYTKEEYANYLKDIITDFRSIKSASTKDDSTSISKLKELKLEYIKTTKDAKKDYGNSFIATLKEQAWNELFEGKENATSTSSEVTSLQAAFKDLDTSSLEFKEFIEKYQKLYVTLSAYNNSKNNTTQKFNDLADSIESNRAWLTDKQLEVAKYLIDIAKKADAKTREQTANNPQNTNEQQARQAKENRINKMVEDGFDAEQIIKVFGNTDKSLILDLIKKHNKKLQEEKTKLQNEIENGSGLGM